MHLHLVSKLLAMGFLSSLLGVFGGNGADSVAIANAIYLELP